MNSAVRSVLEIVVFAIDLALLGLSRSPAAALSRRQGANLWATIANL